MRGGNMTIESLPSDYSDPFIMLNSDGEATGTIIIPNDATVSEDKYNPETNVHTVMFKFWDKLHKEMQHCLYEINYNNHEVTSFIKDRNFDWYDVACEKLEGWNDDN